MNAKHPFRRSVDKWVEFDRPTLLPAVTEAEIDAACEAWEARLEAQYEANRVYRESLAAPLGPCPF